MDVSAVAIELFNYFSCQNGRQFGHSVPQIRVKLVVVIQGEVTQTDEASQFKLTEKGIDQLALLRKRLLHCLRTADLSGVYSTLRLID